MKFPRSIRWQLQLWHGLLLLVVLTAFGFTAYQLEKTERTRENDAGIQHRLSLLVNTLRSLSRDENRRVPRGERPERTDRADRPDRPPPPPPAPAPSAPTFNSQEFLQLLHSRGLDDLFTPESGYYYAIWMRDTQPQASSAGVPTPLPRPSPGESPSRIRAGDYHEAFIFAAPVDCVLVGRSMAETHQAILLHALFLAAAGAVLLTAGLLIGSWLTSRALRPVHDISRTATRIASGDLSQRVQVTEGESELGSLATVLNTTFARLEAAFSQQARFTTDAAHELRTPLTVLLTQMQSALARERPAEDYRQALSSSEATVQRMRRLIESLLELARLDAGQEALHHAPCDLAELAAECAELIQPLADARRITIKLDLAPAPCHGDPQRLSQVITNLLKNAIDYNHDGGSIHLRTHTHGDPASPAAAAGGIAMLEVSDTGPGIPEPHRAHIFERFYRVDPSRKGHSTGLGLAISKAIMDHHSGKLELTQSGENGSSFRLELPQG